jgi:arylsulfatase A-like enzyme
VEAIGDPLEHQIAGVGRKPGMKPAVQDPTADRSCKTRSWAPGIVPVEDQLKYFYDVWGSDQTYNHMAVAWSWAFDTPFKWTKQIASHFGGTRQGVAIAWPQRIKDAGGIRNQFHHVIDIVPTILEVTGIPTPAMVNGIAQKPIEGVSMAYTFDPANADAPSTHRTQYFEMMSDRALYHDGLGRQHASPQAALGDRRRSRRGSGQRLQMGAV